MRCRSPRTDGSSSSWTATPRATNYPYAERVELGGARVNYARASVRATVDAFSGEVRPVPDRRDRPDRARLGRGTSRRSSARARRCPRSCDGGSATRPTSSTPRRRRTSGSTRPSPDVFVSDADVWSRPIAPVRPDRGRGRRRVRRGRRGRPPAHDAARRTSSRRRPGTDRAAARAARPTTRPHRGQNLVATLSGWVDENGQARAGARRTCRATRSPWDPPRSAGWSSSTPRVRNLLGLRNLEIRDLDTSSLDAVLLGRPHLLFLPGGVVQIQSLYEGREDPAPPGCSG